GNYEVRLYFANGFAGTGSFGERLFHVEIEDRIFPALYEIDLSGTYGHATGTMISHILEVTDGNITVKLLHSLLENPLVNGIEILKVTDGELPIYVGDLADQLNLEEEPLDGSLLVNAAGGDGNLNYSASGLPPGLFIEPTNGQIGGTISPGAAANSPYTVTVVVDDGDGSTEDQVATNFMWTVLESDISFPVLRINAGGAFVSSTDLGADWQANATSDAFSSSLYSVNTGAIYSSKLNYANRDASIPSYIDEATYNAIFAKERYDRIDGEEMEFKIPLTNGYYIANLYLGNSYSGTNQAGDRIFDILIEGNLVRDNLDLIPEFGHKSGGMLSFPVLVSDGELNIGFLHQVENPLINAIEILGAANLGIIVNPIADQVNDEGEQLDGTLTVNASGGEGALSFSATGLPPGIAIEPSNGQLFGTIEIGASTNSPYTVSITVDDSDTITTDAVTVDFMWSVQPVDTMSWIDKDENENYTARHECSFTQAGDKFYLMGGRENSKTLDVYDYTSNTWTSLEDSAPLEFNHFQATEYKGLIWVIGSFKDNNFSAGEAPAEHIWAFDPANEEWIQGPEIPVGRRRGSSGLVLYNDKFYVVGGNTNGHKGGFVSWFDEYDPSTGIWTPLPDAPRERDHFHAALIGDKLYAAGGRLSGGPGGVFKPLIAQVDVYEFTSGSLSKVPMDDQNKH
ncbi:MAG: malectin domain-containing carbohydrate-binding protein, partial [Bacteroidota bacterium]